jgi:hypothetical protein
MQAEGRPLIVAAIDLETGRCLLNLSTAPTQLADQGNRRGQRLRWWIVSGRRQLQLVPADVVPGVQLPADAAVDADRSEAEPLMQADAGRVQQGDAAAIATWKRWRRRRSKSSS